MLQQIQCDKAILGVKLRKQSEPNKAAPAEQDQHHSSTHNHNLFNPSLACNWSIFASLDGKIQLLIIGAGEDHVPEE